MNQNTVPLPSRESVTATQVQTLLSAISTITAALFHSAPSEDAPGGPKDGGARTAAETTLINLYSCLDSIVEDPTRWRLNTLEALEKKCNDVYTAHLDLMASQKEAVTLMKAPHRQHSPTLLKVDDGTNRWVAFVGNIQSSNVIIGVGMTPAEALEDFDKVFNGAKPAPTVETTPTNEKHLDPGTAKPVSQPPKRGKDKRRSRPNNGKD